MQCDSNQKQPNMNVWAKYKTSLCFSEFQDKNKTGQLQKEENKIQLSWL